MNQNRNNIPEYCLFEIEDGITNLDPVETGDIESYFYEIDPYFIAKTKLDEISNLENNWDGYDSIKISENILQIAHSFILCLSGDIIEQISDIYPNSHGTITIEWLNNMSEKFSLEIGNTKFSYFILYKNNEPKLVDGYDLLKHSREITKEISTFLN